MDKKTSVQENQLKQPLENLCLYVEKKLDQSTRDLCSKLQDYHSEIQLIHWLKQVFMTLISSKSNLEQLMTSRQETQCGQYEQSLQKLEAEIRQHIAIEQQMKINYEGLLQKLQTTQSDNLKLGSLIEKYKKKDVKEKQNKEKQNKENRHHNDKIKIVKKKIEQQNPPKTARGRSITTMVRDKSRARLDWQLTENIDFTNQNIVSKINKRPKNMSKSKVQLR